MRNLASLPASRRPSPGWVRPAVALAGALPLAAGLLFLLDPFGLLGPTTSPSLRLFGVFAEGTVAVGLLYGLGLAVFDVVDAFRRAGPPRRNDTASTADGGWADGLWSLFGDGGDGGGDGGGD